VFSKVVPLVSCKSKSDNHYPFCQVALYTYQV
jgi:hypothetical protein